MIRPTDVAHVNLNVTDLDRADRNVIELVASTLPGWPEKFLDR